MRLNVKKSSNITLEGGGGLHNSIVSRQGESRYVVHLFLNSKFKIPEINPKVNPIPSHQNNSNTKYFTHLTQLKHNQSNLTKHTLLFSTLSQQTQNKLSKINSQFPTLYPLKTTLLPPFSSNSTPKNSNFFTQFLFHLLPFLTIKFTQNGSKIP